MNKKHDVVIVGAGHNGLACAAYLVKAGLDVLVLERRDVLGGAAATEETWPGYLISSASYVVSLLPPRIVDELHLNDFGYRVSIVTPDYFVPYPDGSSLTLWGDLERDTANIARFSKRDADAYAEFDRYFERVGRLVKDLLFVVPPNIGLRDLPRWAATAARLRRWNPPGRRRGRPPVHPLRGRLPGRVVRGRTDQGRPGEPGHHRGVGRADEPGLGVRPDARLDRRGGRP